MSAFIAMVLLSLTSLLNPISATTASAPRHPGLANLAPCQFEDGPGPCYWDATTQGNHQGRSYWIDRHGRFHSA